MKYLAGWLCAIAIAGSAAAQQTQPPPAPPAPEHHGKVLFERDTANAPPPGQSVQSPLPAPSVTLTDAQRNAPVFTAYDLDVHLRPAAAEITVHARLRVRNSGDVSLAKLAMQLSSTLRWDSISLQQDGALAPAAFARQTIESDVDHTGRVAEAVVTLPHPLAPGQEAALDVFYSGSVPVSAERLERIGAPHDEALAADWDGIGPVSTALRGIGNVIWYPIAAAPALLGDGARLFHTIGQAKQLQSSASTRLRLSVEYLGEPPDAAYFCGRRDPLKPISENADVPVDQSPGVATAEWAARPLGFRAMSLFLTRSAPQPAAGGLLSVITEKDNDIPAYADTVNLVEPLLADWFGSSSIGQLTLIDHPGQPFEDGDLLVEPMQKALPGALAPSLAPALTHAWFRSRYAWLDQGMAEFISLLWLERTEGRDAAVHAMAASEQALALTEPADALQSPGPSLLDADTEAYYRTKAAAVLWMLRSLVGDEAMKQGLREYRLRSSLDNRPDGFEQAVEIASGRDLKWLFDDWVYHDRGLPDLTLVSVTPSRLTNHPGENPTWLVAVEVKNNGNAGALVPVTVSSAKGSTTRSLQVAARSSAIVRILFSSTPERVEVNDGSVPEMGTPGHTKEIRVH